MKGGLRLDTAEAFVNGGESGPAVVPGDPDKSRLVRAVRGQNDLQMPPDKKLAADDAGLLAEESRAADPLAARKQHFPGKAKQVIFLFMHGGVSHVDTFDPNRNRTSATAKRCRAKPPSPSRRASGR